MGSFETRRFFGLMERCPNLYLDTTMAFAPIRHEHRKIDTRLNRISVPNDDLLRWQDRIVFGSDFPNLPYPYEEERDALWLRDLPPRGLSEDLSRQRGRPPGTAVTGSARVRLGGFGADARAALEALARLLGPGRPAWLVGGAVRDALSGGGSADVDVAVPSGAIALARELAALLGGALHVLDERRGAARVARGPAHAWRGPQIDIADFRASGLDGDLAARDFTVNALAVPVEGLVADGEAGVEDPTGGIGDLRERTVRLCSPRSFDDDPVRVLRAARLGAQAGWRLDPALETAALQAAPGARGHLGRARQGRDPGDFRRGLIGDRPAHARRMGRPGGPPPRARRDEGDYGAITSRIASTSGSTACAPSRRRICSPAMFGSWRRGATRSTAHLGESLGDGGSRGARRSSWRRCSTTSPSRRPDRRGRPHALHRPRRRSAPLRMVAIAERLRLSGRMTARAGAPRPSPPPSHAPGPVRRRQPPRALSLLPGPGRRGARCPAPGAGRRGGAPGRLAARHLAGRRRPHPCAS